MECYHFKGKVNEPYLEKTKETINEMVVKLSDRKDHASLIMIKTKTKKSWADLFCPLNEKQGKCQLEDDGGHLFVKPFKSKKTLQVILTPGFDVPEYKKIDRKCCYFNSKKPKLFKLKRVDPKFCDHKVFFK